jgi:hypothetical protein
MSFTPSRMDLPKPDRLGSPTPRTDSVNESTTSQRVHFNLG